MTVLRMWRFLRASGSGALTDYTFKALTPLVRLKRPDPQKLSSGLPGDLDGGSPSGVAGYLVGDRVRQPREERIHLVHIRPCLDVYPVGVVRDRVLVDQLSRPWQDVREQRYLFRVSEVV